MARRSLTRQSTAPGTCGAVSVGVADAVIAYECPDGQLQQIDGHLRADVAADEPVPVLVRDVDEDEAKKLLLSLDPLAAMAETSRSRLQELLSRVEATTKGLDELMATHQPSPDRGDQSLAGRRSRRGHPTDVAIHGLRRGGRDARCTRGARPDRLGQFAPDVRSPTPALRLGCRG
jgi:hypothetical protein